MAQQEYHVFPKDDVNTPGTPLGDGSLTNPWDLQTALSQTTQVVNGNDTIWLHEGIYKGRFVSTVESRIPDVYVTVSAYDNDKVILDGNIESDTVPVLEVNGKQVIFQNFDITWLGEFSRDEKDDHFRIGIGVRHLKGANCKFYNLKIHDIPGLGFGFWKHGEASVIQNCMIYNNGYISKIGKGTGEGIYVQNLSDKTRLIKDNIIFNNYYKGIEVWSAGKRASYEYVKHITLDGNILFNNGSPSGNYLDNVIVASDDKNGINVAKHITLENNILYHNTRFSKGEFQGDAPSLTLGFNKLAPIEDVIVRNNVIIGRANGLRILEVKTLSFTNNIVHTGFVQLGASASKNATNWNFVNNAYYANTKASPFRLSRGKDYTFENWKTAFTIDERSSMISKTDFELPSVLAFNKNKVNSNRFYVALFDKEGMNVSVDVRDYNMFKGDRFTIYDAENPDVVLKIGQVSENGTVTFPMNNTGFQSPLHNSIAVKTPSNFGAFIIEFKPQNSEVPEQQDSEGFFERFFKWLGF
ncbi:right-handed parallel beta-helix repeat-containing protein [Psychroserpens sp. XS_ASV72]|uniref:right-handed parallel beta-helix repeat-containing protein n=1 Tax=Psychroserpens sp. XS_ASV72 TaxID=3241293 RepID=UPI0035137CC4